MLGPEQFAAGANVMRALAGRGYIVSHALCGNHVGEIKNINIVISIVISMVIIITGNIRSHVLLKQYTSLGCQP